MMLPSFYSKSSRRIARVYGHYTSPLNQKLCPHQTQSAPKYSSDKRLEGSELSAKPITGLERAAQPITGVERVAQPITGLEGVDHALDKVTRGRVRLWLHAAEDLTGLSEVRKAQEQVKEAEDTFMAARREVQETRIVLDDIQSQLAELRLQLDRMTRDDERCLDLATREHRLLQMEKRHKSEFTLREERERDCFSSLSASMRESHERERIRAENTKNWSVIGSLVGVFVGAVTSTAINHFRMKQVKDLVAHAAHNHAVQQTLEENAVALTQSADRIADYLAVNRDESVGSFVESLRTLREDVTEFKRKMGVATVTVETLSENNNKLMSALEDERARQAPVVVVDSDEKFYNLIGALDSRNSKLRKEIDRDVAFISAGSCFLMLCLWVVFGPRVGQ